MDPYCPSCRGGKVDFDSGGQGPNGEWINLPCPECCWVKAKYIPLRMHDITPYSPIGHWLEVPCPYCFGNLICRYVGRDNDIIEEDCEECNDGLIWYDSGPFREEQDA